MKYRGFFAALAVFAALSATAFAQTVPFSDEFWAPKQNNKFPDTASGRKVLMGDFHTQTDQSHGGLTPEDRMLDAYYWGLDVIAITDHGNYCGAAADTPVDSKWIPEDGESVTWMINHVHMKMKTNPTIDAYKRALPLAKKYNIILLPGVETGVCGKEHIVAVNIPLSFKCSAYDHWLSEDPGTKGIYYQDRFKEVCSNGGFMIYVHPHYGYAREQVQWGVDNGYIMGIEVMNGSDRNTEAYNKTWGATWGEAGWRWYGSFDYALKNNIGIYANTDSHEERGGTCTLVLAKERTVLHTFPVKYISAQGKITQHTSGPTSELCCPCRIDAVTYCDNGFEIIVFKLSFNLTTSFPTNCCIFCNS